MGLKSNEKAVFVIANEGKFYTSKDKEREHPYDSLEGKLTGLDFKNETLPNGREIEKLYITIRSDQNYKFGVPVGNKTYSEIISMLLNIDTNKDIDVVPAQDKQGDKIYTKFFIKQNGEWVKHYYSQSSGKELPKWIEVDLGKEKKAWNKTAWEDQLIADVEEIKSRIPKSTPPPQTTTEQDDTPSAEGEPTNDLPF